MPAHCLSVASGPATSASPRNLLERQALGPDRRPTDSGGDAQLPVSTSLPSEVVLSTQAFEEAPFQAEQATHLFQRPCPLPCLCTEFLKCRSLFLVKSCLYSKVQFETLLFPGCHSRSFLFFLVILTRGYFFH